MSVYSLELKHVSLFTRVKTCQFIRYHVNTLELKHVSLFDITLTH